MLALPIQEGLTFDDVLVVPAGSDCLPKDCDVATKLTPEITLGIPLLSAAMDTVTEAATAIAMAQEGGLGILHKNWSPDRQASEVTKVKKYESGVVSEPVTIRPDQTLGEVAALAEASGISGFPVVEGDRLVGMLTNRDRQFEEDLSRKVREVMTPAAKLVTAALGVSLNEARELLHRHRVEKLPLVDGQFQLKGMMTSRDLKKVRKYPRATKDHLQRLRVGAAIGASPTDVERAEMLLKAGVDVIVV
ncbi:MAG: IMP dehydrogenase, partial [Deltaproteobacteria bacterium]|nr:IMP dehydrogenase [Deltaproteobacteria bacterium]